MYLLCIVTNITEEVTVAFDVIYQTQGSLENVSSDIKTLRSGLKNEGQASTLNQLRSISDERRYRVSDIASQSVNKS